MPKGSWRQSPKSLENRIDPEKDEELKKTKTETEDKVARIMKLINRKKKQGKKDGNSSKDSELVTLVEDFHKQYQALYLLHENLREEVREKVYGRKQVEDASSTSTSDSDQSFHSAGELSARNSPSRDRSSQRGGEEFKLKLDTSRLELIDLRNKLTSLSEEKEALLSEHMASLSKAQESEKIIESLRIEFEQTQSTKQKLVTECAQLKENRANQVPDGKASTQIKELEHQVSSLKLDHKKLHAQKKEIEEKAESQVMEAKHLAEENSQQRTRVLELERTSKEKENKLSALQRKLEENESISITLLQFVFKFKWFHSPPLVVKNLQLEVDTLQTQKGKLEEQVVFKSNETTAQVKGVMDQVDTLQKELHSLSSQKNESESSLEKVTSEISDFLSQIEDLKENLEGKSVDLQRILEEKKGLEGQIKDLELEVGSLHSQKSELEGHIRSKNLDLNQLTVEKEGLNSKITQLEQSLSERDDELSVLYTKYESLENNSSLQIKALVAEVDKLQEELQSLQSENNQLEMQAERESQESEVSLFEMQKENGELTRKIERYQETLQAQDDALNKLKEESKQNLQMAERKIDEIAEEFRKQIEDSFRIVNRRLQVAEQLHLENKEVCQKTKENYENKIVCLREKLVRTEAALKRMKDVTLAANNVLNCLDSVALKFEECNGNFLNRISKFSCEILFLKDWVRRKNNALKHVHGDVDCLLAQLDIKEGEILGFRERVWKLEHKVRDLERIVQEKEEGMLGLGEEKREAIRQLCVWMDYHRSRSDYLKKILSDMNAVRSQRT
ncbi:hypothetical protein NMG60_11030516, partial [Bertholletia excelsa]